MADFVPWQARFATEDEWRAAKAELSTLRDTLPPAEYDRLWAQGTLSDIRAAKSKPAAAASPPVITTAALPPTPTVVNRPRTGQSGTEQLLDAQNKFVEEETISREAAGRQALTEDERDAIRGYAADIATKPRTEEGNLASSIWDSLVTPEPGSWNDLLIPDALRPQKLMSAEETAASKEAMKDSPNLATLQSYLSTENPKSGETYENTISWLGRVLSAPASAVVGALDPNTTISERVKEGEGFAGGTRDLAAAMVDVGKENPPPPKSFLERNTSERALLALAYGVGMVGDLLVPFDLGVGDAAKAAKVASEAAKLSGASRVAAGVEGFGRGLVEANTLGRIPAPDARALAATRIADNLTPGEMAAVKAWGKAVRETAPAVDTVAASPSVLKKATELGLPTKMESAQAILRLADKEFENGQDIAKSLARIASARKVASALEPLTSARGMTRIGNVVVPDNVATKVKAALKASPLAEARAAANVVNGQIEITGDLAKKTSDYIVESGTLARWRAENPRGANIVRKGADKITVTPDQWNDLVRLASEAEAFRLSDATAVHVKDIPSDPGKALAGATTPKPMQVGTFAKIVGEKAKEAGDTLANTARRWAGFAEKGAVKGVPVAITEWLTRAQRMIGEAPNQVLNEIRIAARQGTRSAMNPIAATRSLVGVADANREAFQTVFSKALRFYKDDPGNLNGPVSYLASLFGDQNIAVRYVLMKLAQDPESRVHALASAMLVPGKELDSTIRITHALRGKTLEDLISDADRVAYLKNNPFADDLPALEKLSVNTDLASTPMGAVSAWLVEMKKSQLAMQAGADLLRTLGGTDPFARATIQDWVRNRVFQISWEVEQKGLQVEFPEAEIQKFVLDDLLTDMAQGDLPTLRDDFMGQFQLDSVEAVTSPAASLHADLGTGRAPTVTEVEGSLKQSVDIFAKLSDWSAPSVLMQAIDSAAPHIPAGSRQVLAQRIVGLVDPAGDVGKQVAALPLTSAASISDEFAQSGNTNEIESLINALPNLDRIKPTGILSALAEGIVAGASYPFTTILNVARQGLLGGMWLPNLGFHTVNVLTAPTIIWGTLGGDRALGALSNLAPANTATRFLYARLGGLSNTGSEILVRAPNGATYTTEQIIRLAVREGALGGQASTEVTSQVLADIIRQSGKNASGANIGDLRDLLRRNFDPNGMSWASEIGQTMDTRFRLSVMIDALKRGEDEGTAISLAREALFDYGAISDIERATIAKAVWFYSFLRSSVSNFATQLVSNPSRVRNILRTSRGARGLELTETDRDAITSSMYGSRPLIPGSITKVLLNDKQTQERYAIFGPPVPMADSVNTIVAIMSLANVLTDPGLLTPAERVTETAANVAEDLSARSGPFAGLAYDLATGRRPSTFGPREDSDRIDPEYVILFKALGAWDTFQSYVEVEEVNKGQAPEGKEATYFDNLYVRVKDTPVAKRNWAALKDGLLAIGVDRPVRDTIGVSLYWAGYPLGEKVTPGNDLAQAESANLEDLLRILGAIRMDKVKTAAQKEDEQKTQAARDLRNRTPDNR